MEMTPPSVWQQEVLFDEPDIALGGTGVVSVQVAECTDPSNVGDFFVGE
jgi:hypothetical protein